MKLGLQSLPHVGRADLSGGTIKAQPIDSKVKYAGATAIFHLV
jgi:hypothetical protein